MGEEDIRNIMTAFDDHISDEDIAKLMADSLKRHIKWNSQLTAPKGYRFLEEGEMIQLGDLEANMGDCASDVFWILFEENSYSNGQMYQPWVIQKFNKMIRLI